jgi:hypothetical protein
MLDESTNGLVSLEPVKREGKRSQGRHKLKNAGSGTNGPDHQPDVASNDNSLSKPKPEPQPSALQRESKGVGASVEPVNIEVDGAVTKVSLNGNARIFGTNDENSVLALAKQVISVVPTVAGKLDLQNLKCAFATIYGIGPKDELEALLVVQMMGVHNLAMKCLQRAAWENQTTEGMEANIHLATKLNRTFTAQMEALNRHRGKLGQPMVVGNVNVNEGGQAVVGPVTHHGRGKASSEDDGDKVE